MSENEKIPTRGELEQKLIKQAREDETFKKSLMEKPHEVYAKFGVQVPQEVEIKVVEESARMMYLVLPVNPDELTDEQLDATAGGLKWYDYINPFTCDHRGEAWG